MNKKLLTLAVAGAFAAPVAAMADATLYGKIHISLDYADVDKNAYFNPPVSPDPELDLDPLLEAESLKDVEDALRNLANDRGTARGFDGWKMASRASRLGVKGSEDLGGGLKGIYQIEMQIPIVNENDDLADGDRGRIKMRNTFVGLASDWGTLLAGRHDTPMKISTGKLEMFGDTMADYNDTVGFVDIRADSTILYISPNFSGFQLAAATVPGSGVGDGTNVDSDSLAEGYSVAGIYKNGPFYASLAYEAFSQELSEMTGEDWADDYNQWRVGLGLLDWNGFSLTGIYESQSNIWGVEDYDADLWQVQAGYAFGNNMVKAMYGSNSQDGDFVDFEDRTLSVDFDDDINSWAVGFDHNFSKRTTAYALYTSVTDDRWDDADWSGFSVGMIHKF